MATQEGAEIRMEENPQQGPPGDLRQNSDGSSPTEVLETMRNLIVTNKSPKDDKHEEEVSKKASNNYGAKTKKEIVRLKGHLQLKKKPYQTRKENKQTTLKENLKILDQLLLMESLGQEKKSRHGCWTSKSTSKSTTIPAT
jgi:hypothetical protein